MMQSVIDELVADLKTNHPELLEEFLRELGLVEASRG